MLVFSKEIMCIPALVVMRSDLRRVQIVAICTITITTVIFTIAVALIEEVQKFGMSFGHFYLLAHIVHLLTIFDLVVLLEENYWLCCLK